MLRQLVNQLETVKFYESTFDTETGLLVRAVLAGELSTWGLPWQVEAKFKDRFSWRRNRAFSPVPETIDIAINSWCNFGCTYCYTDATVKGKHAPLELVKRTLEGFSQAPYQAAFGGGSPTQHPDFIKILELTKSLNTVPNYTTEGQNLTDKILEASQELCGGIALTFHASRGIDYFLSALNRLRAKFRKQINIHLIVDRDIVENLELLNSRFSQTGKLNLVFLAFYPDVGRASLHRLMPKNVYMNSFPESVKKCLDLGHQIAFSEGLIPYFLSRPEIGVDTRMATPSEGCYSCAISVDGRMDYSSFDSRSPRFSSAGTEPTVFSHQSQELWEQQLGSPPFPYGASCDACQFQTDCTVPNIHHYLICKFAQHNQPEAQPRKPNPWDQYESS